MTASTTGLSSFQRNILLSILRSFGRCQEAFARGEYCWEYIGGPLDDLWIRWSPGKRYGHLGYTISRSECATFSRSLKRLEHRGLVERGSYVSDANRTTMVRLTESGRAIAEAEANG